MHCLQRRWDVLNLASSLGILEFGLFVKVDLSNYMHGIDFMMAIRSQASLEFLRQGKCSGPFFMSFASACPVTKHCGLS